VLPFGSDIIKEVLDVAPGDVFDLLRPALLSGVPVEVSQDILVVVPGSEGKVEAALESSDEVSKGEGFF